MRYLECALFLYLATKGQHEQVTGVDILTMHLTFDKIDRLHFPSTFSIRTIVPVLLFFQVPSLLHQRSGPKCGAIDCIYRKFVEHKQMCNTSGFSRVSYNKVTNSVFSNNVYQSQNLQYV